VEEHLGLCEREGKSEQPEADCCADVQMRWALDQDPEPERRENKSVGAEDPCARRRVSIERVLATLVDAAFTAAPRPSMRMSGSPR
jgi:hypothetical protein